MIELRAFEDREHRAKRPPAEPGGEGCWTYPSLCVHVFKVRLHNPKAPSASTEDCGQLWEWPGWPRGVPASSALQGLLSSLDFILKELEGREAIRWLASLSERPLTAGGEGQCGDGGTRGKTRRVTVMKERGKKNKLPNLAGGMRHIVGAWKCSLNAMAHRPFL